MENSKPIGFGTLITTAIYNPDDLCELIHSNKLSMADLSFACEAVGYLNDKSKAISILHEFKNHPVIIVREGVINGANVLFNDDAKELLADMSKNNESEMIKSIARETLELIEDDEKWLKEPL